MMHWRCCVVACALIGLAHGAASAATLTWSVTGGTFSDGGTVSGTFVLDSPASQATTFNLSVAGGGVAFPARTYTPANSTEQTLPLGGAAPLYRFKATDAPLRELRLTPTSALDGSIASVPLDLTHPSDNVECFNCAPFRLIKSGSLLLISAKTVVTLVSVAPDPTTVGALTTATVSIETVAAFGPPTGTITVRDGSLITVCTITLPALSCPFNAPGPPGGKTLRAQYNGDANYASVFSNALSFTVLPVVSTVVTLISVAPNPTTVGATTTATVSVATIDPNGAPTGTVEVFDDSLQSLCTVTLPAASCTFAPATPGDRTLIAQYSGDTTYASAFSNTLPLTVTQEDGGGVNPPPAAIPALDPYAIVVLALTLAALGVRLWPRH